MWMRIIVFESEVVEVETKNIVDFGIDAHSWQRSRVARELQVALLDVVIVDVCIAESVHKVARTEAANLCHHHGEERIRSDIERHTEEDVGRALIELAAETPVCNIELEETMARRQSHILNLGRVPCRHHKATAVGIVLDLVDEVGNLVDSAATTVGP